MMFEVLALGVLSALRPATAQAAVIALLSGREPRRSLLAYTVVGFVVSTAVGVLIVSAFDGVGQQLGHSDFAAVLDILMGVAAVGFAAGVARGQLVQRIAERRPPSNGDSRITRRLREPSLLDASLAGIFTHVPGLIYLVALNAIAASHASVARAAFMVAVYNLLWFALPITALGLAIRNPAMISAAIEHGTEWARRNRDRILVVLFGVLGVYLVVKGVVELLD